MKENKQYFIFNDNGATLWTEQIEADNEQEAIRKATLKYQQLSDSEKNDRQSFLLCEGYDGSTICGGFYDDDDSEGSWIIDKEICDFLKDS